MANPEILKDFTLAMMWLITNILGNTMAMMWLITNILVNTLAMMWLSQTYW